LRVPAILREPARGQDRPTPGLDLRLVGTSLGEGFGNLKRLEIVEMVSAIASGSQMMGAGDGWFHDGQGRYGWKWLAERHGVANKGKIARAEFRGPADLFDRLDIDRDGVLTPADFDWSERAMQQRTGGFTGLAFFLLDRDGNGRISKKEWDEFFAKAAAGKDHLTREDLREALQLPRQAKTGGGPRPDVLLKGLIEGELGSLYEGPRVGQTAPDFTLKTYDRKRSVTLSKLRGKPVVLVFGSFT
jgi:hypothetical protein